MSKQRTLTQKQWNFALAYISNGCKAYDAAIEAGYTRRSAYSESKELVNHPMIKDRIDRAYQEVSKEYEEKLAITVMDKAKVLQQIIYDIVPQDGSPPKRDRYGDAIKAIVELNKMAGHYAPARKVSVNVDATKEKLKEIKRLYKDY